jgi:hypothetical protein
MFRRVKPRRMRGSHRCVTSISVKFGKLIRNGTAKVGELCDNLLLLIVSLKKHVSRLWITIIDLIPVFLRENVIIWLRSVMEISQGVHTADEPLPGSFSRAHAAFGELQCEPNLANFQRRRTPCIYWPCPSFCSRTGRPFSQYSRSPKADISELFLSRHSFRLAHAYPRIVSRCNTCQSDHLLAQP